MKVIKLLTLIFLVSCATDAPRVEKILRTNVRQCFTESDSYRGKAHEETGSMTVKLSVLSNNKVADCSVVKSDFKDPNLKACVCEQYSRTEIKNTTGKTEDVLLPVNFGPVNL